MDFPASVATFTVTGRLAYGVEDGPDAGIGPDLVPVQNAHIVFTPDLDPAIYRVPAASLTVFQEPVEATTNADGELCGTVDGTPDVELVYGLGPEVTPSGWTWRVQITVEGFPVREFSIAGSAGGVVDLGGVIPVPPDPGGDIPEWAAVVAQALSARDGARLARDEAVAAAASLRPGEPGGVATLGGDGRVPESQIPPRLAQAVLESLIQDALANYAELDSGGLLPAGLVPDLPASKIASGTLAAARVPNLDAGKITTGAFNAARIPDLDAAKIATGILDAARIPNLDAAKIATGQLARDRLPFAIEAGFVLMTPTAADAPTSVDVVFSRPFAAQPVVLALAQSAVPGTQVKGVGVDQITTTGCKLWLTRSNTNQTGVLWIAVTRG